VGDAHGGIHLRNFLHGEDVGEVIPALSAEFRRVRQPDQSHFPDLPVERHGKFGFLVALEDAWKKLLLGKFAGHLPDGLLLGGKLKIHGGTSFHFIYLLDVSMLILWIKINRGSPRYIAPY
jgi:hypothetical protein